MSKANLIVPMVNLNGSNIDALIDARSEARAAIDKALKALLECAPHGRDYQTDRSGIAYANALTVYREREKQLQAMYDALMDEMIAIDEQRAK